MTNQNTRGNNDTPHGTDAPTSNDAHATDLTRFQLDQLAAIAWFDRNNEQCHDHALEMVLAGYHGESVPQEQLAEHLDVLVSRGLVTAHDAGDTTHYELTVCGHDLLHDRVQWLAGLVGGDDDDSSRDDDGTADGAAVAVSEDTDADATSVALPDGGRR